MLLERLQLPFSCQSPDVDESPRPAEPPAELARRLAAAKARAVAGRQADDAAPAIIIGSDQVAECEGALLGKPGKRSSALQQLSQVSGKTVYFHTAVHVVHTASGAFEEHLDQTRVRFRALDPDTIERYLAREPALDCAGAFKSEGLGIALVEALCSDDPTALIGLPLIWLSGALRSFGLTVP
jgi:septum formation protein